jgi:hypothetical protein
VLRIPPIFKRVRMLFDERGFDEGLKIVLMARDHLIYSDWIILPFP